MHLDLEMHMPSQSFLARPLCLRRRLRLHTPAPKALTLRTSLLGSIRADWGAEGSIWIVWASAAAGCAKLGPPGDGGSGSRHAAIETAAHCPSLSAAGATVPCCALGTSPQLSLALPCMWLAQPPQMQSAGPPQTLTWVEQPVWAPGAVERP